MIRDPYHIKQFIIYVIIITVIGSGCNTTKNIPEGDFLYKGVKWETRDGKIDKDIKSGMVKVARPKPNANQIEQRL